MGDYAHAQLVALASFGFLELAGQIDVDSGLYGEQKVTCTSF